MRVRVGPAFYDHIGAAVGCLAGDRSSVPRPSRVTSDIPDSQRVEVRANPVTKLGHAISSWADGRASQIISYDVNPDRVVADYMPILGPQLTAGLLSRYRRPAR